MEISLITFNVSADFLSPPNVSPWDERKALCAYALRQAQPSIIFTPAQEEYTRLTSDGWRDSRAASAEAAEATFMDGCRIDYIFYRGAGLTPQAWARFFHAHRADLRYSR